MSEVGVAKPKVSLTGNSSSEFDVFVLSRFAYASRDVSGVSCVRCRARGRSRARPARGSGNRAEAKAICSDFLPPSLLLRRMHLASRGHSHVLLQVFRTRLMESKQFLKDMEKDIDLLC